MKFLNRDKEMQRLQKALESKKAKLIIIYGRRRCGKSTLIKNILKQTDVYFVAQQTDEELQRTQFAQTIGEKITGFDAVSYPNWESLFVNLNNIVKQSITICIDEFPYLVKSSSGLPSVIQKMIDNNKDRKFHLVLCGSSQQMMRGMIMDSSSPLFGRSDEIMKIIPLEAVWLGEALGLEPGQTITEYSVWGGVPRYWELRANEDTFDAAVKNIILDRYGVLHEEPARLFLDDMRESVQAFSILSVVGNGSNRLSEIAGRLNKPATHLSRPIDNLIQLGYLKREVPFGENEKNSKKSIYRISEPFINFYFRFITPNLSRLGLGLTDQVFNLFESVKSNYVSVEWENLCRKCIPMEAIEGRNFDIAYRWWGTNENNKLMELDVVSESIDKKYLLVGECKWSKVTDSKRVFDELVKKAKTLSFSKGKKIMPIIFVKEAWERKIGSNIYLPENVLQRLK
jgi:uncharacterized protein